MMERRMTARVGNARVPAICGHPEWRGYHTEPVPPPCLRIEEGEPIPSPGHQP